MIKLKHLKNNMNEAIEDIAKVDEKVYGTMGYVMADAINTSKKRKEEVKKVMEERKSVMPNQDRFAHTKVESTPELKKMHLSEDAFQLIDLRNRGNKSRRALKESIDENKLVKFMKDAYAELTQDDSDAVWHYKLGNGLYYVMACYGDPANYDEEDVKLFATSKNGVSILLGKIAVNSDDLQSDYGWDWTMPYDEETSDVWDTEREFYKEEDFNRVAQEIMSEYN